MLISSPVWLEITNFLLDLGADPKFFEGDVLRRDSSKYLSLLLAKNEQVNLTAVRDEVSATWKHLADSLSILSLEPMGSAVDWGSGGGLPGIPLALARRAAGISSPVFFLDSVGKKVRAVEEFCDALSLSSCRGFHGRGEEFLKSNPFGAVDTVLMRAVAPAERAVHWISPRAKNWIFLLGPMQLDEWKKQDAVLKSRGMQIAQTKSFLLPHEMGSRVLLKISKCST